MPPVISLVDTIALLEQCIADISGTSEHPVTCMAIDLEGVNLSREGRLSLLQIMPNTSDNIWIVDVTVLGSIAFSHLDAEGRSLKSILQDASTEKVRPTLHIHASLCELAAEREYSSISYCTMCEWTQTHSITFAVSN